jgi:hypothetical protein
LRNTSSSPASSRSAITTVLGVGVGVGAALAQLFGRPQAEHLVAAGLRLEQELLVMREFLLEAFLALVESAHARSPSMRRRAAMSSYVASAHIKPGAPNA